jgi:hypothetical protein
VENKERNINIFTTLLVTLGLAALVTSVYYFPVEKISVTLIILSVITIFFSSYLRIQLPRTKIHLTVSETLVFFALLYYGGEVAVLLATLESVYASYNLRREGLSIKHKTVALNLSISVITTFVTAWAIKQFYVSPDSIAGAGNTTVFVGVLVVLVLAQFTVNSILVAIAITLKTEKTLAGLERILAQRAGAVYRRSFYGGLGLESD